MAEMKREVLKMRPTMHNAIHENMNLRLPWKMIRKLLILTMHEAI